MTCSFGDRKIASDDHLRRRIEAVTLDPTAPLAANTVYQASIRGGYAGVIDVTGSRLAAGKV